MSEVSSQLTTRELLLLCQGICEFGTEWSQVLAALESHPLWTSRKAGTLTEAMCQQVYTELMTAQGHDMTKSLPGADKPKARVHVKLARKWYMERVNELRTTILMEEERFKLLATEIEEIKAGQWDERLVTPVPETAKATKDEQEASTSEPVPPVTSRKHKEPPIVASRSPSLAVDHVEEDQSKTKGRRTRRNAGEDTAVEPNTVEPSVEPETPATAIDERVADDENEEPLEADTEKRGRRKARGTTASKNKRKASETPIESAAAESSRKRVKTEEGTPSIAVEDIEELRRFRKAATQLVESITREPNSDVFLKPVTKNQAPMYHEIVLQPMWLNAINGRIKKGDIRNISELRRDVLKIFANACVFNPPDSEFVQEARAVARAAESLFDVYETAERANAE